MALMIDTAAMTLHRGEITVMTHIYLYYNLSMETTLHCPAMTFVDLVDNTQSK